MYSASKGGVVNLTRALAMELAPDIRVNCVCPGWVDTDMLCRDYVDLADAPAAAERGAIDEAPLRRVATPEEIAKAIAYLASHDARFVTGIALPIDGGTSPSQLAVAAPSTLIPQEPAGPRAQRPVPHSPPGPGARGCRVGCALLSEGLASTGKSVARGPSISPLLGRASRQPA